MRSLRSTEDRCAGFSPVIATILMVLITVVLAAVLFVVVMNYEPAPPKIYHCDQCDWYGTKADMKLLQDSSTDLDWGYDTNGDWTWTYDTDTTSLYLCPCCGTILILETS